MGHPALALPLGALLLTAQAPDKPPNAPMRDVTVEYVVQAAGDRGEPTRDRPIKVYWTKGGALMRIEMGDERSYVVLDRDTRRMTMVLLDGSAYVETAYDPSRPTGFTVPPDLVVARGRNDVVADTTCTLWHARRAQRTGSLCVTEDGVLLRAEGYGEDRRGDLVATSVIYGPQPPAVFAPPPGFHRLDLVPGAASPGKRPG